MRFYRVILALALLLLTLGGVQAQEAQRPAEPPIQWPRSRSFDMEHFTLKLAFDWEREMVLGEATLRMRPFHDTFTELELDAAQFSVESVRLASGQPLQFSVTPEQIRITLDRAYRTDESLQFTVKYTAQPKRGLRFIKPTPTDPARPYQIWTQGQVDTNHYWFPCYDFPNDRATSETIVTVESKYRVISNGELASVTEDKARGLTTYHWRMDQPFSSYLASVIVGEFAEIKREADGIPVIHYVYKDQVEDGARSFANVPEMVKFFAARIGHRYPFNKYAETTVRDFGGGMENITASTLSDRSVKDQRALLDHDDSLSAHELAHQWFGDLITCRDWSELWLNEGFANFFAALWIGHLHGQEEYLRALTNTQLTLLDRYERGRRRPIVTRRYFRHDDMFDENSYSRGQIVLHMLKQTLGEEAFWRAIRHYVHTRKGRLVTTADFALAIEEATGQNLDWFFDQWVYKMGQPELELESNYDESARQLKLKVKQVQKGDESRPWFEVARVFRFPVEIAITTAAGTKIHKVVIDRAEQEIVLPADTRPLIVNFDRGSNILKKVKFQRTKEELIYQLRHDEDVTGRWRAARELRGISDDSVIAALISAVKEDRAVMVRLQAVDVLGETKSEAARAALIGALEDRNWRVRRQAVGELGNLKDASLLPVFKRVIEKDPSYNTVTTAAVAAGETGVPAALDILLPLLKQSSWRNVIAESALEGIYYVNDARALQAAIEYAAPSQAPVLRGAALRVLGVQGKGNSTALALINSALAEKNFALQFAAVSALNAMADETAVARLEQLLAESELHQNLRNTVQSMVNRLKQPAEKRP